MWTVELQSDYRGRYGRVVTDYHLTRAPNLVSCMAIADNRWQRTGRRLGTAMYMTFTGPGGVTIRRTFRRPY